MKKSKGQTVDFLYVNKNETEKKTKKTSTKKEKTKNNKKKNTKKANNNNQKINLDNEIIIGLTPKVTEKEKTKSNKKRKTSKKPNKKKTKNKPVQKQKDKEINLDNEIIIGLTPKVTEKEKTKNNKKKRTSKKPKNQKNSKPQKTKKPKTKNQKPKSKYKKIVIKWTIILILVIGAIVLFMLSSVFNIKQIIVVNNEQVSTEEIISLSTLQVGVNMFKVSNTTIREGIKSNAYIEDVNITKSIDGTITLEIEERTATYMLELDDMYAYINNQGYILEVSETALELPIITGYETQTEQISAGNRLIEADLIKLSDVIKIMETAKNLSLADLITQIDISDSSDYVLTLESESKTISFGDVSNVDVKLRAVEVVLEAEEGKSGEIYFQDTDKTIFREEVTR